MDRPDLVLIMTDQQRHDQTGYASDGHFRTPTLDRLAADGVVFDTAYSAATTCVPARTSLLTGLAPHRLPTQENGAALREGFWTVAHALRNSGYETALIGKMHFAPVHAEHGFETMRLCEHLAWQGLGPLSRERDDEVDDFHLWLRNRGLDDWRFPRSELMPSGYPADAHPTAWVAREAVSFLARRDRRRPVFLVVSFPHPHAPYDPPEPYRSMFRVSDSRLPRDGWQVNESLPLVFQLALLNSPTRSEAERPETVQAFLATVRGLVTQIDDAVAEILVHLDMNRTVLFFTSDHGDYSGHRGLMRKNPAISFDDLARVPLFATGAGIHNGRRVTQPVQSSDIALTLLDYSGTPRPDAPFETRSLRPILEGSPADPDRLVVCGTHGIGWPMIRQGPYKYMEHHVHREAVLFDLEEDPSESVNLVDHSSYRDIGAELAHALHAVRSRPILDISATS